jgi:ribosome maturation factor RimP
MMADADQDAVGQIIERVTSREGFELVHWEILGPSSNLVLRIFIDKEGGVNLNDCEMVSNQVGLLLDVEDAIPNRYTLEVSSPGLNRGLYKLADYQRFAGSRVKLKTSQPINGQRNFRGRVVGVNGDVLVLDCDNVGRIEIPYGSVVKANIEYEF